MPWVTNEHGLIEGHEPDNLLAYDNEPQFCRAYSKEQYELLYQKLNPIVYNPLEVPVKKYMFNPYLAGVLKFDDFDPVRVKESIRTLPSKIEARYHMSSGNAYVYVKSMQALIQQVADEYLPLFVEVSERRTPQERKVLKVIVEWRLKL